MKLIKFEGKKGYNKINHLPFNRHFEVREDLMEKIRENGFTVPINLVETDLIDGKKKLWLADGQNRAITAAFMDVDFYGVVIDKEFTNINELVNYVAALNSLQKPWKAINYAEVYNFLNLPDYAMLLKVKTGSGYSVETISAMMSGFTARKYSAARVKSGLFKADLYDETLITLSIAQEVNKVSKMTARMILGLHYCTSLKNFNKIKFIRKYLEQIDTLKRQRYDDYSKIFMSWMQE